MLKQEGPLAFRCMFWSLLFVWGCDRWLAHMCFDFRASVGVFLGCNVHVAVWWMLPFWARCMSTERYRTALLRANDRALLLFGMLGVFLISGAARCDLLCLGTLFSSIVYIILTTRDITNAAFTEVYAVQTKVDQSEEDKLCD